MHLAPPWSAEKEDCFKQQKTLKEINGIEFLSPIGWVSWRYTQSQSVAAEIGLDGRCARLPLAQ